MIRGYESLHVYYGDIHNHCGISYGHGSIEDAFANARMQLDFCSVTGHGHWPDMPRGEERLEYLVAYHEKGFAKLRENWKHAQEVTEANNENDRFVTFLSYEWHCMRSGDYTIVYKGSEGDIIPAATLAELKRALAERQRRGIDAIAMPHHISYPAGYRGINWADFTPEFTPIVEIVSMHGCSESDDAPYPPFHTMGPRDHNGTAQHGLALGHIFGFVGNTDHHGAHPGSYGGGRTAVWAESLTRDGIWEAFQARRTYALTGDRIEVQFAINGHPMGSVLTEHTPERHIELFVKGGAPIDYVELVKNNQVIHRVDAADRTIPGPGEVVRTLIFLEVGWGERIEHRWDVYLGIDRGEILAIEPRFRGGHVVAPRGQTKGEHHYSSWWREGDQALRFQTWTSGNPTSYTNANQGMALEVEMPVDGKVVAEINGKRIVYSLRDLLAGGRAGYLGGFLTPAYRFHRCPLPEEYEWHISFQDTATGTNGYDFYYVRVRQKNDQWAWSSPIWVA
ncbi:MAG TPA: DUF3604 domain-containing protein [Caldilineae bacterium]|nr:DUF3604 domain-containing protein [Caldilineae bacterium]